MSQEQYLYTPHLQDSRLPMAIRLPDAFAFSLAPPFDDLLERGGNADRRVRTLRRRFPCGAMGFQ